MAALSHLVSNGLEVQVQGNRLIVSPSERLNDELRAWIRDHKPELLRELQGRWNSELAGEGYIWCLDCQHWNGDTCGSPDNPFRNQQPLAPRKCRWFSTLERDSS